MSGVIKFERVYRREADPQVEYRYHVEVNPGPPVTWWAAIQRNGEFMGTASGTIKDPPSDPALLKALVDDAVLDVIEVRYSAG